MLIRTHARASTTRVALVAVVALAVGACADSTAPSTSPTSAGATSTDPDARASGKNFSVFRMRDDCDSATFNTVLGAGTCITDGHTTLDKFIAQLTKSGVAPKWRFNPPDRTVNEGVTLLAVNLGGEVHTFTTVQQFGGGVVDLLNQLSHNPTPAPECLALEPDDFVPPGGSYQVPTSGLSASLASMGSHGAHNGDLTLLIQCCIHPWMRSTVHVHG